MYFWYNVCWVLYGVRVWVCVWHILFMKRRFPVNAQLGEPTAATRWIRFILALIQLKRFICRALSIIQLRSDNRHSYSYVSNRTEPNRIEPSTVPLTECARIINTKYITRNTYLIELFVLLIDRLAVCFVYFGVSSVPAVSYYYFLSAMEIFLEF